jgi:multiple sugar transport system permease protein
MGYRLRTVLGQVVVAGLTTLSALVILVPIVWMTGTAVRPIAEILTYPPRLIPSQITGRFFLRIIQNPTYQRFFVNSVLLSASVMAISIALGLLAAFGFSRFKMKGGRAMLMGIVGLLMLPPITVVIPYFRMAHTFHMYDTVPGLVLVDTAFVLPIVVWLLKGYLDAIPVDLEEAAQIDGCTRLQALTRILLPLAMPGIIGTATFAFIFAWNEYLLAVVLTDSPASQPLTIGLAAFFGQYVRDWNSIMALATMTSLPLMLVFIFFQRWVVQGLTAGAVK